MLQEKLENRKLILQQLLQKSQIFNQYLKNQQNVNSIINISSNKRSQIVQFGKCEIGLPEKVKAYPTPKFNANKIMVLTKNKKEAMRMKQKYENLYKLRQSQGVNLQLSQQTQSQRPSVMMTPQNQEESPVFQSTKHRASSLLLGAQQRTQTYDRSQSPQRKNCSSQLKCKPREFVSKNRSNSAKVRPQFDFFLKYNNHMNTRQDTSTRYKVDFKQAVQVERSQNMIAKNKKEAAETEVKVELYEQECMMTKEFTENCLQQQSTEDMQNPPQQSSQLCQQKAQTQQPSTQNGRQSVSPTLPSNPSTQRRYSSFSIKKHPAPLLINKNYQQNLEQQKKNKINFRRQLHKTYNRTFIPPPKISAKSFVIYEMKQQGFEQSGKILATINGKNAQQVASLTKIMTCIITLEIASKFQLKMDEQQVEIGKFETNITGTSALLKSGQIYTVEQLLHGLMMPSGNDASLALGVWGGRVLTQNDRKSQQISICDDLLKKYYKKDYIARFVEQMNSKAQQLGMTRTKYANTHGLVNNENKSSAIDIALLCQYAMSNEKFASIVGTKNYLSKIRYREMPNDKSGMDEPNSPLTPSLQSKIGQFKIRQIHYRNTHYLLHKKPNQYIGVKTGVTNVAGPCLASCIYHKDSGRKFLIVVLDCKSMMMRFKETQILKKWLFKQQNLASPKLKKFKPRTMSLREDRSQLISQMEETSVNSDDDYNEEKCEDVD